MNAASLVYGNLRFRRRQALGLLFVWIVLVSLLILNHAFWRDEVRALSFALAGEDVFEMLKGMRGDGHPAVWYLLLRGAFTLFSTPAVLPLVSFAVAFAAVLLLAWRSPFGWLVVAALMLGRIGLYEYSVMARNYGISMLFMFSFAALYQEHRHRGIALGLILLLLANTNAHSVILVGAFLLFWLLDILLDRSVDRPRAIRTFCINAAIATVGVLLCLITIYPTFNDAAQLDYGLVDLAQRAAKALLLPASSFDHLFFEPVVGPVLAWQGHLMTGYQAVMSIVLIGSTVGLARRPAAMIAAWSALFGLSVFFAAIYTGNYRHEALWLVFLVSMYWIAGSDESRPEMTSVKRLGSLGSAMFLLLLGAQFVSGIGQAFTVAFGSLPESRSRDLAQLIASRPDLREATILADPDFLVEPLPYYLSNRTYLMREERFGNTVRFTRDARLSLSLEEVLASARAVQEATGGPVVILLHLRLDPAGPARVVKEGYNWTLSTTPAQVEEFLSQTQLIARFGPSCCNDESFDVYVLNP